MSSRTIALVALCILTSISSIAAAGDSRAGGRERGPGHFGDADPQRVVAKISRYLQLDESDQQQLENIALAAEPQLRALQERAQANRKAIGELDPASAGYGAELQDLAAESGQIATEMTMALATLRADVHAMLTEEQRQMLTEAIDQRKQQFRDRRQRRDVDAG